MSTLQDTGRDSEQSPFISNGGNDANAVARVDFDAQMAFTLDVIGASLSKKVECDSVLHLLRLWLLLWREKGNEKDIIWKRESASRSDGVSI